MKYDAVIMNPNISLAIKYGRISLSKLLLKLERLWRDCKCKIKVEKIIIGIKIWIRKYLLAEINEIK